MTQIVTSTDGMSVVYDAFKAQVSARPDADAIVFPDVTYSYAKLARLVDTFAFKMQNEFGVGPGALVMLQSREVATVISFHLAASALGASIVERNDDHIVPKGQHLTHHFHAGVAKSSYPTNSIRIDADWSPAQYPALVFQSPGVKSETVFLYNFSSGTTGLPKVIPLSHDEVLKRSLAASFDFKSDETRFATLLPVGSRPYIARALAALANGAAIVDGTDPQFWLAKAVTLVSGSVRQMVAKFENIHLSRKIREAEVLGSRLTLRDATLLLRSFDQVQDAVGASEASKFYVNLHTLENNTHHVVGKHLDSEVEIIDVITGQPTASDDGILRVRNPYLANGYIDSDVAQQSAFRDGWFYTGDTARWGQKRVLEVSERENNVINIGGNKIHAALIDRVLSSTRGIRSAIAFKNPKSDAKDEVFAFVVFDDGVNQLQASEVAKMKVEELLGPAFVPRVIRGVAGLPRLDDGSPDRKACANFILQLAKAR